MRWFADDKDSGYNQSIISEDDLRREFDGYDERRREELCIEPGETFEEWLRDCCDKSGTLTDVTDGFKAGAGQGLVCRRVP